MTIIGLTVGIFIAAAICVILIVTHDRVEKALSRKRATFMIREKMQGEFKTCLLEYWDSIKEIQIDYKKAAGRSSILLEPHWHAYVRIYVRDDIYVADILVNPSMRKLISERFIWHWTYSLKNFSVVFENGDVVQI